MPPEAAVPAPIAVGVPPTQTVCDPLMVPALKAGYTVLAMAVAVAALQPEPAKVAMTR